MRSIDVLINNIIIKCIIVIYNINNNMMMFNVKIKAVPNNMVLIITIILFLCSMILQSCVKIYKTYVEIKNIE